MLTCRTCGKPIARKPGAAGRNPHYCSHICRIEAQRVSRWRPPGQYICKHCGRTFIRKIRGPAPTYCSKQCGDTHRQSKRDDTWKSSRQCIGCGATYIPRIRKQQYCSMACGRKHQGKTGGTVNRVCASCGKPFVIDATRHNTANCEECRKKRPAGHLATTRNCLQCGKQFHPRHDNKGYCSKSCGQKAYASAHRIRKAPVSRKTPRTCRVCQKTFMGGKAQFICSPACYKMDRHMRCWARRSHYRETAMEPIDFGAVCERDHWTCGICGQPVDPSLKWPNPGARSLDHIIPISAGGPHLYDNVQLAHLLCNWRKAKPRAKDGKAFHTPNHPLYPASSQRTARGNRGAREQGRTQPKQSDNPPAQEGND